MTQQTLRARLKGLHTEGFSQQQLWKRDSELGSEHELEEQAEECSAQWLPLVGLCTLQVLLKATTVLEDQYLEERSVWSRGSDISERCRTSLRSTWDTGLFTLGMESKGHSEESSEGKTVSPG